MQNLFVHGKELIFHCLPHRHFAACVNEPSAQANLIPWRFESKLDSFAAKTLDALIQLNRIRNTPECNKSIFLCITPRVESCNTIKRCSETSGLVAWLYGVRPTSRRINLDVSSLCFNPTHRQVSTLLKILSWFQNAYESQQTDWRQKSSES